MPERYIGKNRLFFRAFAGLFARIWPLKTVPRGLRGIGVSKDSHVLEGKKKRSRLQVALFLFAWCKIFYG